MNVIHVFKIGVFIILNMPIVKYEVFTAIENVRALLKTRDKIFRNLKQYIDEEEMRLKILKGYKVQILYLHIAYYTFFYIFLQLHNFFAFSISDTCKHEQANKSTKKYVENPINAFKLIKRLSVDFEHLKKVASEPTSEFFYDAM